MSIIIYGKDNCDNCNRIKNILNSKNISFEYINDLKTLMITASKARIMSAPVIEYNNNFYSFNSFLEVIANEY